jgi:fatty acid desaturase
MSELDLRASDGDRERVVDELRAHAADGRLTVEELEERVQQALAARTLGELADLTRDLPERRSPAVPRPRRSRRPDVPAFLAVMALLVAIWALTGAGYFWPIWPLVGWGFLVLSPRKALGFRACHPSGSSRR